MGHLTLSLVALLTVICGCQTERCGTHYHCHNASSYSPNIPTGIIVAIVISVIIAIALIVGIVICCVFCCNATTSTPGTVYRAPAQQVTMVTGTENAGFAQPPPAYPGQNNAYPMATTTTGYGKPSAAPPAYPMTSQYGDPTIQQKY